MNLADIFSTFVPIPEATTNDIDLVSIGNIPIAS